jgi:hypothetical protein
LKFTHTITRVHKTEASGEARQEGQAIPCSIDPISVGQQITAYAKSLDPNGDFRLIQTSPVIDIVEDGTTKICTTRSGSVYKVSPLSESEKAMLNLSQMEDDLFMND